MRTTVLVAKIAITVALLTYLYFKIDFEATLRQLRFCDSVILLAGTSILALLPLLGSLRWHTIVKCIGSPTNFSMVTRWNYVGVFFGQILPASFGCDAVRMWLAYRGGCSSRSAVNSVGLDRVVMTLSLALLFAAVAPSLGDLDSANQMFYLSLGLLFCAVLGSVLVMLGDRLPEHLRRWRTFRAIGYLARDARQLLFSARFFSATMILSLLSYFAIFASVGLFTVAFGATFSWWKLVTLLPPVLLVSTLPISIGGWGTREMAMVLAFGSIGIDQSTAILVSLWVGVASILISVPGGIVYLIERTPLTNPDRTELETSR